MLTAVVKTVQQTTKPPLQLRPQPIIFFPLSPSSFTSRRIKQKLDTDRINGTGFIARPKTLAAIILCDRMCSFRRHSASVDTFHTESKQAISDSANRQWNPIKMPWMVQRFFHLHTETTSLSPIRIPRIRLPFVFFEISFNSNSELKRVAVVKGSKFA